MPEIAAQYDQPLRVFPMIYIDQLSRAISRHVKVVLSGNGGDEIFCGYSGYNRQYMARFVGGIMQFAPRFAGGLFGEYGRRQREAWRHPIQKVRSVLLTQENRELATKLLTADYLSDLQVFEAGSFIEPYTEACAPRHYLDTILYSDLMVYHQHANTVVGDISGMRYALEIRSPLLDHRLIEFAYSLPRSMCMPSLFNDRRNKLIMKRYLERDFSHSLIYADKMGMGHAITSRFEVMMRGQWRRAIAALAREGRHRELGIFSDAGIEWALEHSPVQSWHIFNYALWAEIVLNDRSPDELREFIESRLDS
jgi:asparagine synthase (glutamine-hydrolysing)